MDMSDLESFFDKYSSSIESLKSTLEEVNAGTKTWSDVVDKSNKIVGQYNKTVSKTSNEMKQIDKTLAELEVAMTGAATAATASEKASLAAAKATMLAKKAQQELVDASIASQKDLEKRTASLGKAFGNVSNFAAPLATLGAGLTKSFTSGGSAVSQSSALMGGAIDAAGAAVGGIAGAAQKAGGALAGIPHPAAQVVGAFLSISGTVVGAAAAATAKAAKFANEVLSKEVEKTVKSYNEASAAGGVFANGMTGLKNAATDAGLTVEQFSSVMVKNRAVLGASGLSVAEAAKQVGRVGLAMRSTGMADSLLRLGYGFEEQAELTAQTMADLRRAQGGMGKVDDAAVKEQTAKYAQNLRLISQLTGEDAKAKMEKIRQENLELGWQQKMAEMDPKKAAAMEQAMLAMSDIEKKAFKEQMVLGTVVDKTANIYLANSAAAQEKHNAMMQLANSGNLDLINQVNTNVKYAGGIQRDFIAQKGIGQAAFAGVQGPVADVAKAMGQAANASKTWTEANKEASLAALQQVQQPGDKLTDGVVNAEKAMQSLAVGIQEKLLGPMTKYAEFTEIMLKGLDTLLADVFSKKTRDSFLTAEQKAAQAAAEAAKAAKREEQIKSAKEVGGKVGAVLGGVTGAPLGVSGIIGGANIGKETLGTGVGSAARYVTDDTKSYADRGAAIGTAMLPILGTAIGGALGGIADMLGKDRGYADGGISSGSKSGHLELLHGTEAVVPLPGGKAIPIDFGSTLDKILSKDANTLNENTFKFTADSLKMQSNKNDAMMQQLIFGTITDQKVAIAEMVNVNNRLMSDTMKYSMSLDSAPLDSKPEQSAFQTMLDDTQKLLKDVLPNKSSLPDELIPLLKDQVALLKQLLTQGNESISAINELKDISQRHLNTAY